MVERLPAQLEATALIRRAEAEGGFGTILKGGDKHSACLERALTQNGDYRWQQVGPAAGVEAATLADWSQKRVRFDEDLWLIELDIPDPERFVAEMTSQG